MRIDAALANQFQFRQPLQKRRAYVRTLPDQHQRFGIAQPFRQGVDILDVIVPDGDVVPGQLGEAIEGARSEEHTSELQSHSDLVCRLLLEKKKTTKPER